MLLPIEVVNAPRPGLLPSLALLALVTQARVAGAEPLIDRAAPNALPPSYAYQLLVADTAAAGAAYAMKSWAFGIATFSLASPTIHLAHGHSGRALCSLALHTALPALGFLAARKADTPEDGMFIFAGSLATALLLDVAITVFGDIESAPQPSRPPPALAGLGLTPTAEGGLVSWSGRF